jgi:hypothetical protein
MSLLPIALLSLLLVGAAFLAFAARPRPSAVGAPIAAIGRSPLVPAVAAAILFVSLLVWLLLRSGADTAAWQWTGVVLWLLVAITARLLGSGRDRLPAGRVAMAFVAAAAALPALWAAGVVDERARLGAVALFAVVGLVVRRQEGNLAVRSIIGVAAAVLLLWAAAVAGAWSAFFALAAAAVLLGLGVPNGAGAADDAQSVTDELAPLLAGLATVVGAAVLLPWLRVGALPPGAVVAATAVGLLGLLVGPARLGGRSADDVARALAPALGGMALVAGVWAGEGALLPAVRLAVFVPAVLWLLAPSTSSPLVRRLPRLLPAALAYLALAGLPLTVGFGALSRLYATWLPGGWVLLVVVAALLSVWLAVVYQSGWATVGETGAVNGRAWWLGAVPAALAALGLLHLDIAALAQSPLVWAAVLLPTLAGVALGRFVPALSELGGLLRESVGVTAGANRVMARFGQPARRLTRGIADALGDAAGILDGDNGLLVLLGLLLLLLWIGR